MGVKLRITFRQMREQPGDKSFIHSRILQQAKDNTGMPDAEAPEGGSSAEIGILRNAVPRWLNEQPTRVHILAFATAQQRDGGSGALYVLLRRQR